MPLLSRGEELRALERALAGAAAKEGGVLVLSGEPGIGKTTLLKELAARAEAQGFRVHFISSLSQQLPAKQPLWRLIGRGLTGPTESTAFSAQTPLRIADGGGAAAGPMPLREGVSAAALLPSMIELLERLSSDRPLLVAVDDIHHADGVTLELLRLLSHSLERMPVLFALGYTPSGFAGRPEEGWMVEMIAARGAWLEITALDHEAAAQLLCDVTGSVPDQWVVRFIRRLTGGNPRFILECDAVAAELQRIPEVNSPSVIRIPSAIRVAIKQRLGRLTAEARKVLEIGALFPNAFDAQLISEAADFDEAEAHAAIAELQSAGLVRPVSDHTYDYAHEFTRELLYREMPVPRRSYLHRRIASALEVQEAPHLNGNARQIAEHLMRSGDPQMLDRAIRYAQLAAAHFSKIRNYVKAAEMYSIAIAATESGVTFDAAQLCELLTAFAEVQRELGHIDAAQQTFCRAARLAQDLQDTDKLVRVALGMPDLGWPLAETSNGVALIMAEKSLASLGAADSAEKVLLTARVAAESAAQKEQRSRSEAMFARAVEMERRLPDRNDGTILALARLRDRMLRRPERIEERLANADDAIEIARRIGDNNALFASAFAKMCALSELGDTACAQDQFALMQHAATLADRPAYRVVMLFLRSTRALRQGRLNLAADLCREARDIAEANGLENLADQYWTCLAVAAREQGRIADLLPIADRNCEAQSYSYSARAALCWLHYQAGNVAQAAAHLEHLAAEEFADIKNSSCSMATAALLAEISAELKIVPYAAALYDFLLPFRDRYAIVETAGAPFGSMSRYLGKLAVALSNYGQAVAHFEDAVNSDRKTGERVWTAYSMLEMANSLLLRGAPGDRERAGEILKLAAADGTDLGMHLLGERISKLAVGSAPAAVAAADPRPNSTNSEVISRIPLHKNSNGATMLPALACARLHQMNTGWELSYDGRSFRLKGLRGLTIIAYLLSRPGQSVSTLELACLGKNGEVTAGPNPASDLGPVLDEDAKRAYRTRVQELNEQLEQARAAGNETAALEVEEELCFLTREIARAVGLFGRDRRTGSDSERARVRITNSIKFAIAKIAEHEPALASYLLRTIRTGASCCYVPDSGAEINWDL